MTSTPFTQLKLANCSLFASFVLCFLLPQVGILAQENRCANIQTPSYFQATEKVLQQTLQNNANNTNLRSERTETTYTIPIIFHIMHQGEAVGEGNNISYEQILSQMTVLNEDYNKLNADTVDTQAMFKSVSASANIKFVLASVDNKGNKLAEPGVERRLISKKQWELAEFHEKIAPTTIWNPLEYLNVWVIDSLTLNGIGYVGYGQFPDVNPSDLAGIPANIKPSSASATTDGVIMDYNNLGAYRLAKTPQLARARLNQGRTLTHEIGHFLGVRHIFSDNGICEDDFCNDTPIQSNATRITTPCNLVIGRISCGTTSMVQNFMDYSHDICMNIFSKDQVARMRIVLEKCPRRKELLTSSVITGTEDTNLQTNITIYPNPTKDKIYIKNLQHIILKNYILHNTLGQTLQKGSFLNNSNEISLQNLPQGIYYLEILTNQGTVVKKLNIE
jgi:zinc-dependent metalloproteinase lipoprotein